MAGVYLSRQPLVNRQSRVIATRLSLHADGRVGTREAAQALAALANDWPHGEKLLFINASAFPAETSLLEWAIPENVTLEVRPADLLGPAASDYVATLRSSQPSLCLIHDAQALEALASGLRFRFVAFDAHRPAAALHDLAVQMQAHGIGIALNVPDRAAFRKCLDAGVNAAASWFFTQPSGVSAKKLNSAQAQIVRVLNLVRKNADVKEVEEALKQDVALSYKLLRYINSAGFGPSCEIQSFFHAVTILGYDKLNKWLSLLLVTASKDPMAPALMHAALTRARLMELLGHGLVDPHEYDNLFITGAFSLLDVLLGVSMEKALESMNLPESICDALLERHGIYAPFLDLACVSESANGQAIAEQVALLGLSANAFNSAQLQALGFAETMES